MSSDLGCRIGLFGKAEQKVGVDPMKLTYLLIFFLRVLSDFIFGLEIRIIVYRFFIFENTNFSKFTETFEPNDIFKTLIYFNFRILHRKL